MLALGISLFPGFVRLMCGQALTVKESDYILAEHSVGSSDMRVMIRHVFPNCLPPLIVMINHDDGHYHSGRSWT